MKNRIIKIISRAFLLLLITLVFATIIPAASYAAAVDARYFQGVNIAPDTHGRSALSSAAAAYSSSAAPGSGFTFVVTSDMQQHSGPAHDITQNFRGVCEKISSLGEGAFMVSPGDLDPPSDVDWTVGKYLGDDYLWYPVVGNHDEETTAEMS
ncbi:MAG: hypothetical protein A2Z29_02405 [Chloroflexi bacterium RBG_16_56_11]|nr:MAG: hypothetical protein A2Z29_02405 [Chloroflexi bacterium RBG_16_56_11]